MNTLVVGYEKKSIQILKDALLSRHHKVKICTPQPDSLQHFDKQPVSLVVLSDYSDQGIQFCRRIRALETGKHFTIVAVLGRDQSEHFHQLLDAGIDQYIVESLFDEQRLDVRLAFAEKMARQKEEQHLIEKKLRESEARARSILKTTVDAIITIDKRGSVRTFNEAAERLFLYDASEVIGKNVKLLMPQPYRREHDQYIQNYHTSGERKIIGIGREVTGRRKDGSTFPMYLAVSEVNANGQRLYTGIIRNVTEQRRLEQEVLRVSEHERHRIGQDLHDGLGQMLTGISLINKNIALSLQEESHPLAGDVREITRLIKDADEYARNLSRSLIPVEFDSHGLTAALRRLAGNAEKLFSISCTLHSEKNLSFEDTTSLVNLYRIVQEAINNAVKHGNAARVEIRITADSDHILVKIEDNGSGFPENWEENKGLGVRIMQFRARLIGADLQITDSELGGAAIVVTLFSVGASYSITD